jgi:hypothetical protein
MSSLTYLGSFDVLKLILQPIPLIRPRGPVGVGVKEMLDLLCGANGSEVQTGGTRR